MKPEDNLVIDPEILEILEEFTTGDAALREAGIQVEFAAHLILHFSHFGTGVSLRVGTTPSYDGKRIAKPGTTPSKNSNHGLVNGFIPIDPALTKIDEAQATIPHHPHDKAKLDAGTQPSVQLNLSMREILASLEKDGDMEIVPGETIGDQLVLKYRPGKEPVTDKPGEGSVKFSGKFYIDLNQGKDVERQYSVLWNKPIPDPDNTGEFLNIKPEGLDGKAHLEIRKKCLAKINDDFPICYGSGAPGEPLKVFAAAHPLTKEMLPITGDWDFLVLGHPPNLPDYAYQVFHTLPKKTTASAEAKITQIIADKNIADLASQTHALFKHLKKIAQNKKEKDRDLLDKYLVSVSYDQIFRKEALNSAGSITPFEFLQALMINHAYQQKNSHLYGEKGATNSSFDANIINLVQHGCENRSPYKPSPMNGKMLHFYRGLKVLTRNEDELIKLYLSGDYLKNSRIDVHHGWDMKKWGPVIVKQKILGQSIPTETLRVYENYQYMKNILQTNTFPIFDPRLYEAISHNREKYQPIDSRLLEWHRRQTERKQLVPPITKPMLSFSGKGTVYSKRNSTEETRPLLRRDSDDDKLRR